MANTFETYCPACDTEVCAPLVRRVGTLRIRGELTTYDEEVAVCPSCGEVIGDSRLEDENLNRAYATYRAAHGIVTPDELRTLRAAYGLSTREFSWFLGFGEQTEHRYETGSIPERAHNNVIRQAMTASGASALLAANADRILPKSIAAVKAYIDLLNSDFSPGWVSLPLYTPSDQSPSPSNGFRAWDLKRISELTTILASRCSSLFVTKYQKAMFFADSLCYERTSRSLTGLTYAHGYYGPMINNRDGLMYTLRSNGVIELDQQGDGEVIRALTEPAGLFSQEELSVISDVVKFVNSFPSATALSNYSHGLSAWADTANGQLVDYTRATGEVERAVRARLGE